MSDIADQITGMSSAFDQYLKGNVQEQQNVSQYGQEKAIDAQYADKTEEGKLTPEMAGSLFSQVSPEFGQAAQKAVTDFKTANNRDMTIKEANSALDPVMKALEIKNKPSAPSKYYMGNDPDGNAIFGDKNGNMFGPDGSAYQGKVLPKSSNMPTSSTRSSSEFATTILPHIDEMRQMIKDADSKGYIGPAAGRVYGQFMAGKVGSTGNDDADQLLGKMRAMDSLLKTGSMRVHFGARGGANMYDHFSDMLNTGKQSAAMLNGSLDTMQKFMEGYAAAGKPAGNSKPENNNDPLGIR